MFFMKACPCGKGEALGLAVVAIEARPLDSKPFERAVVHAVATPTARTAAQKRENEGDKSDRETQPVPDVVQHAGSATRGVRTIKNPPVGGSKE
jgi:hypothetical protein